MHFDFSFAHPTIWVFLAIVLVIAGAVYVEGHSQGYGQSPRRPCRQVFATNWTKPVSLREEAQDPARNSFQRKQAEAEEQAKDIVKQARLGRRDLWPPKPALT